MASDTKADLTIDTQGMACPMPVLKTRRGLEQIGPGQILEVIATDFGAESDIPVLACRLGHTLAEVRRDEGRIFFRIQKA